MGLVCSFVQVSLHDMLNVSFIMQVRYFVRHDDGNASSMLTKEQQTTFTGLRQRTEYGFQVRAKTTHGWGEFSPTVFKTTGQILGTGE